MLRVHTIKLKISNCYLIEGAKKILVDTGSPGEGKKIKQELKKLGVELSDLSLILHTHGHSDHCGSTAQLVKYCSLPTAIHSADRGMIESGSNGVIKTRGLTAKIIKPFVDVPFTPFQSDIFIDDYSDLVGFGVNGLIHHTPGHSKGSISIELENGEAIIGDLMMGGYLGGTFYPQLPDYHYFIDNMDEVHKSIRKTMNFKSEKFYVGHGGPLSRTLIEKRFKEILV